MISLVLLSAVLAAAPDPGPLTLDDALARAALHNPELRLARLRGESAGVDEYASWAAVLPRLDVSTGFGVSYFGPQQRVTTSPSITQDPVSGELQLDWRQQTVDIPGTDLGSFSLGLQLVQPLFDGLRGPRLIERAKLGVVAARQQVDEAALAVSFDVTRRFYEVVKADRSVEVLAETLARSEEYVTRVDALFAAGRGQKSDTIAARVNVGNDRLALENQKTRAEQARAELALALGMGPGQIQALGASAEVDRDEAALREPPALEALVEQARKARPAFARARAQAEQAALDAKIATADYWPQVSGVLSYDRSGPTFAGENGVWGNPGRQFVATAQLSVTANLFNGRQTLAAQQRASIAQRTVKAEAEQLLLQVESELARARLNVLALARAVTLAGESLRLAEEGVALARQRLDAGAATQMEVRDANLKLTQAKLSLVHARIDALVARADLNRAAGGAL